MSGAALIVLAKAPRPGRAKTRLCPPCTPEEAARLAEAALLDTLAAVAATPVARRVLVLDGRPGPWLPAGFEVVAQRGGKLDQRLAGAFADVGGPALLIGMDTPQVGADLLDDALRRLGRPGVDAVLGLAWDGGWWALGLCDPSPADLLGVPMSTGWTGAAQRHRLLTRGRRLLDLARQRDVDRIDDARAVAAEAPGTRFAAALAAFHHADLPGDAPAPPAFSGDALAPPAFSGDAPAPPAFSGDAPAPPAFSGDAPAPPGTEPAVSCR